ncbi:MAG: 2'-5' RNA ligase [Thiomonas sp. 15-66-11]|nr:MAG: 2'-5' RNA ligase [Thiomonas sp. 15-66-11]
MSVPPVQPDPWPAARSGRDGMRLFFALWPQPSARAALMQHAGQWRFSAPARPTPSDKLHLTLLFMDGVPESSLQVLADIGQRIAAQAPGFRLQLDTAALWPRGGIAHLAPSQPPRELASLRQALLDAVRQAGVPHDARAFRPHVTLARRAQAARPPEAFVPVVWLADALSLAQSVLGSGRYAVLDNWRLAQGR